MLKRSLLLVATAVLISLQARAEYDYIEIGNLAYEVLYSDEGPISAQVRRYAGEYTYPWSITVNIPDEISYNGQPCPVTSIAKNAFEYYRVVSITLGKNINWIGEYAFNGCSVEELTLPANVETVYQKSLPSCKKLIIEDGSKPLNISKIGGSGMAYDWNLDYVTSLYMGRNVTGNFAQGIFSNISDLDIGVSVTEIARGLFAGAKKLQLVVLPPKLEKIGDSAFSQTEFSNLEIPPTVKTIGDYAFSNSKINTVRFNGTEDSGTLIVNYGAFYDTSIASAYINRDISTGYYNIVGTLFTSSNASLQNVEFGPNVKRITEMLFYECYRIENIILPEGLEEIGGRAFEGCTSLSSVTLPETLENIRLMAFSDCSGLCNIVLPENLSIIESQAFEGCSSLKFVKIPEKIEQIKYGTFRACSSLEDITFSNGLKRIEKEAFASCSSLKTVMLPEGLERLESYCFKGCSGLSKIVFPSSFTTFFGSEQFGGCTSLKEVICYGETPAKPSYGTQGLPFDSETYSSAKLWVPEGAVEAYKAAKAWSQFYSISGVDKVEVSREEIAISNGHIVSLSGNDFDIEVYTPSGMLLYRGKLSGSPTLSKGVYLVKNSTVKKYIVH